MKEIEIKAKLRNKEAITTKLASLGCAFEKPVTQDDTVYAKNVGSLKEFKSNDVFLRLRIKNNSKVLFTIKKRMSNDLDAIEHETEVGSREQMEAAILMMGYREAVRVKKSRITTTYNGCEICIDEVEHLGSFIEMEKLTTEGDSEKIQNELFNFFMELGITKEDRVVSGYDVLTYQKKEES